MRIQEGHFLKIALKLDLTLSDDGECPALLISSGIIDLGAFCVELWPKQVSYRISVPMSYISCFIHARQAEKLVQVPYYLLINITKKCRHMCFDELERLLVILRCVFNDFEMCV